MADNGLSLTKGFVEKETASGMLEKCLGPVDAERKSSRAGSKMPMSTPQPH